jgi:3-hydroxyacyl-CoA dehydrogenase/enoyl-CoA hydratase/3-hydroxybutyryl-CoA epimerase/enoyl-CoA isomerase
MIYEGTNITVTVDADGIAEFCYNAAGSVNKFDRQTIAEFDAATQAIAADSSIKGVVVHSAKPAFIVGADITEFTTMFAASDEEMLEWIQSSAQVFDRFEDLSIPTIAAINGVALGGGFEMALVCDFRIAETTAQVGLPEVKLGIMPGFGGTVRLPRIIGADTALEWMTTGANKNTDKALADGAIDAVVAPDLLISTAKAMLHDAIAEKLDWQRRKQTKVSPLTLSQNEAIMSFNTAKGMVFAKVGKHYPAPHMMVNTVEAAARLGRAEAMQLEHKGFITLAKTDAAKAQIGIFLADQAVKAKGKRMAKQATKDIKQNAVLGAGIMGGGIAYQGAVKGVPTIMKDINTAALDLGLTTAAGILEKGMQRGKVTPAVMASTLNNITPTLDYSAISHADLVIEAVVENPKIKGIVLAETETHVADDAIITSNTSTISIDYLAKSLQKPERFCGMHFFNPVHRMPLVEIIRGEKTDEATISAVVAMSLRMGKTPIVVNDCPGFFINRVLFPYFAGFSRLILDGADFVAVDKVMEKQFGWPMGPAFLLDVVGIDTADHAASVMSDGIPERMLKIENDPVTLMYNANRLGQKNGVGFYDHGKDKRGRPSKTPAPVAIAMIAEHAAATQAFAPEEVIARLMIPMANESIRCLEEGIIGSPEEADIALLYGIGFPPFRGGIFRYIDTMGLANFVELADKYAHLGPIYQVSDGVREMAAAGKTYFTA